MSEIRHLDLTITPDGARRIRAIFEAEIEKSEKLLEQSEEILEANAVKPAWQGGLAPDLIEAAFDALITQEEDRIKHMREGIEECRRIEEQADSP